jgi:hypothetical protein
MASIIAGVKYGLQVFSILFSTLLIWCSVKVQPINKPPGSLVLVELIFIYLIQLIDLASQIILYLPEAESYNIMIVYSCLQAIRFYFTIANTHYELCIIFELYLRLRAKKINQPFRRRAKVYHAASNFIAFCITLVIIAAYTDIVLIERENYGMLDSTRWIFWFQISYFTLNLATFATIASLAIYKSSKLNDSSVKRYIDKMIKYVIVLVMMRVIYLALIISESLVFKNLDSKRDRESANSYFDLFYFKVNLIPYIFRIFDPHIKDFLKHKVRSMKSRMKDNINDILGRRRNISDVDQTLIPVRKLFDDILIENIEYRFIALAIAMLKSHDNHDDV